MIYPINNSGWSTKNNLPKTKIKNGVQIKFIITAVNVNFKFLNDFSISFSGICRNTKNKRKVEFFREYKCVYISRIYNILKNEKYEVGPYNIFTIIRNSKNIITGKRKHSQSQSQKCTKNT